MSPFRETAVVPLRPKVSESPIGRYRAEAALKMARLQTDARPSRDGFERFGIGSGTQAYGQI